MKILLVNPSVDFDRQFGTLKDFYTPIPSIGLAYIGGVLIRGGFDVVGLDSFIACHTKEEMLEKIVAHKPDVVAFSLLTPCAPLVDPILPDMRARLPGVVIVLGNIHAAVFADHYVKMRLADFVVHHEGEATMLELMEALRDGKAVTAIQGITYFDPAAQAAVKTPKRGWINDASLDDMPLPAWDLFPVEQFQPDIRLLGGHQSNQAAQVQALPIVASRGCPFNCSFCSPKNSIGNAYRERSPKNVVDEMEHYYKKWGVDTFYYMDLTFPISEKKGIEFCDELIARKLPIKWACETRVSSVTLPLLKKMKESNCIRIDYGIEAGNQKMLDRINKRFTMEHVRKAAKFTRQAGIESEGLFIIGLPGETVQDTWDTINFSLSLDLDHVKLNIFVPYPGCDLWEELLAKKEIRHMNFSEYTSYPSYTRGRAPFVPEGRTEEEIIDLQKRGMRMAFFRRRVIWRELKHFKFDKFGQYFTAVKSLLFPPETMAKDTTHDRLAAH